MDIIDKTLKNSLTQTVNKNITVNLPELESALKRLSKINEKIEELEKEKSILDTVIRTTGKKTMINLYNKTKKFPGTLQIISKRFNFKFVTFNRYKKIDKEDYDELIKTYGSNVAEEITDISFNTAILMKHKKHISKLLMGSKELTEEEKENILVSNKSYLIKNGLIENLFDNIKTIKNDVSKIIDDIEPVFSIKSLTKIS